MDPTEAAYVKSKRKDTPTSKGVTSTGATANVKTPGQPFDPNNLDFNNVASTPTTTTAPTQKTESIPDLGKLSPYEIKYMKSKGHKFIANGKEY